MKRSRQVLYLLLIFLTLADILLLCSIAFYPVSSQFKFFVYAFDLIVCMVLWVEFIYSYIHAADKRQYFSSNLLSVIGMLPLDFVFLRALRLIKLLQLIKVFVVSKDEDDFILNFLNRTYLDKILVIAILFIFTITVMMMIIDPNVNDTGTAMWFIVVSMTSTGYGDIVPVTTSSRIVGMIAMIGGIIIFSTLTAVISSLYVSRISRDNHDDLESKINDLTLEIEKLNKKIDELKKE